MTAQGKDVTRTIDAFARAANNALTKPYPGTDAADFARGRENLTRLRQLREAMLRDQAESLTGYMVTRFSGRPLWKGKGRCPDGSVSAQTFKRACRYWLRAWDAWHWATAVAGGWKMADFGAERSEP